MMKSLGFLLMGLSSLAQTARVTETLESQVVDNDVGTPNRTSSTSQGSAGQQSAQILGVDISDAASKSDWDCFRGDSFTFGIVRAWHSYGGFDSNAPGSLRAAAEAGYAVSNLGVYVFPCRGKSAADQITGTIDGLKGVGFSTLWLDIETNPSSGCGWGSDLASNCAYLGQLIDAGSRAGVSVGVYASKTMWDGIMGSACTTGGNLPLWYPEYPKDGTHTCDRFTPFGGWTRPAIHQYDDSGPSCGPGADVNVRC